MKIGVADTMFSRVNMFPFVEEGLKDSGFDGLIERYTVPGVKDLPVACKRLFLDHNCDIVIALGMPGPMKVDKTCSHEASLSIQQVQLEVCKHILEVFVHMDEATSGKELNEICKNRSYKHTLNAVALLKGKTELSKYAGQGVRQGFPDEGPVDLK